MILLYPSWAYTQRKCKPVFNKDTCTTMFIVALFTTAKVRNQPRCPSTNKWINKMQYIYTMQCYSAIKMELCYLQENDGTEDHVK
jgi:hypothetical protein